MKVQIVSDLHIEYIDKDVDPLDILTPSAEILILAGDIGSLYKIDQLKLFIERLSPHFKIIIYVLGNHEFYFYNNLPQLSMNALYARTKDICKTVKNLIILNRNSIIIDNICISGATLWSKPEIKIPRYIVKINGINNNLYEKMHNTDLQYINKMIDYCKEKNLKLVVVTHYPPTKDVLQGQYKRNISLYVNDLDHLLDKNLINTWICGHVHKNFNLISENGTRLIGNQRGKPRENITDFIKDLTVEF